MVNGDSTSGDWQVHAGDICVLPVGAVEQHSAHLPLTTDCIHGEAIARMVAEACGAALLPGQAYGNSLEHSGFRGSVSLRPETLMQVIRDIAEEMERQNFRIMLLVNGHGGNFSLVPVVRDLNRMNRRLKILLLNWWEFCDAATSVSPGDLHAGEFETSVMLALRPELVRSRRQDRTEPAGEAIPLRQADLTTFGVGCFSPSGAVGKPSQASAERGEQILEAVRRNLIPFVLDRIERLRRTPRYSGRGGMALRPLLVSDIPAAMRLSVCAGWNQTEADWDFLMRARPDTCFAAVHNGAVVGTTVAVSYGDALAWIGMVLVDPEFRSAGIGRMLVERAIESVRHCRVVGLDATPLGQPLYESLGFVEESTIHRMVSTDLIAPGQADAAAGPAWMPSDLEALGALDQRALGAPRRDLLDALHARTPHLSFSVRRDGAWRGGCLGRTGHNYVQIGPMVAETPADARALLSAARQALAGCAVAIDVPESQPEFLAAVQAAGFLPQRAFTRMRLTREGRDNGPLARGSLFAIAGPELG